MVSELLEENIETSPCDSGKIFPKIRLDEDVTKMRNCIRSDISALRCLDYT